MFLSTYFPYWSRHETSEKNHTWPASIVIELPILGASNHANVWVFFQTKTAQKNFANAAFVPQNHMFFAKKNTINFECDTKKAHIHPPPPQQKNQNPCLTNKIRTTKKPPHLYIYIHTYLHCPEESTSSCRPFRMVPALRAARRTYRRRRPRPRHQRRCHRRSRPPPPPAVRRRPVPRGRSQRGRQEFFWGGWEFRWCRVVLG